MGGLGGLSGRESGVLWASEIALLHGLGAGHGIVAEEGYSGGKGKSEFSGGCG